MRLERRYGWLLVAPAVLLTVLFFVLPIGYFLRFSLMRPSRQELAEPAFTFGSFGDFFGNSFYREILIRTVLIALAATVLALALALPVAYWITKSGGWMKGTLIILTVFPLLVGNVVRSIGWVAIFGYSGVINSVLTKANIVDEPIDMLHSEITVTVAIASVVLPIMVLTLYASMESVDPATERAALSLGARPVRAFRQVVLPQIVPGIVAGTSLVFVLCMNAYSTPLLVGGGQVQMLAPQIYSTITADNNWPFGASMAVLLLAVSLTVIICYGWLLRRQFEGWRRAGAS